MAAVCSVGSLSSMLALLSSSSDSAIGCWRRVEEGDVLLDAVLEDREVLLVEVGDVVVGARRSP